MPGGREPASSRRAPATAKALGEGFDGVGRPLTHRGRVPARSCGLPGVPQFCHVLGVGKGDRIGRGHPVEMGIALHPAP